MSKIQQQQAQEIAQPQKGTFWRDAGITTFVTLATLPGISHAAGDLDLSPLETALDGVKGSVITIITAMIAIGAIMIGWRVIRRAFGI